MTKEDMMAEMQKGGSSTPAPKAGPKAPPKLIKKPENTAPTEVSGGDPFAGAGEQMMNDMGGKMNQGLDVVVNGQPMGSPEEIADFVLNTPEILNAVQAALSNTQGGSEEIGEPAHM